MPIGASAGTLDIENATLRSNAIAVLTNLVAGNDAVRSGGAPALEVYGDPSHGGNEARLELVSNIDATESNSFTRLTSNAGVFSIQSGGAGTNDDGAITFGGFDGGERMRIAADGNVGIGTVSPTGQLEVHGEGQTSATTFNQSGNMGGTLALRSDDGVAGSGGAVMFGSHAGFHAAIKASLEDGSVNTRGRLGFFVRNDFNDATMSHAMTIADGGNVGIGTVNPQNNLHLFKASADQTYGLFIEKQNVGSGTAQITFGVAGSSETNNIGIPKAGIFFQRTTAKGRGDLKFCINNVDDANSVGVTDAALKITKEGYVQPGQINLSFSGSDKSLGGNYLFQAVYDAYRSDGQTGGTMTNIFQRYIQVIRMGSLISIRGYLPSRQSSSGNLNYRFTWAELGIDGQRGYALTLLNKSSSTYGTWSDTITTDATYLTLTSTGQSTNQTVVNYNSLNYLIDMGWMNSY
jgi:hypothetical protein